MTTEIIGILFELRVGVQSLNEMIGQPSVRAYSRSTLLEILARFSFSSMAGPFTLRVTTSQFFNLAGALLWVLSLTLAGYFFGNLPWIKQNLSVVIVGIIAVSLLPVFIGWLQHRRT